MIKRAVRTIIPLQQVISVRACYGNCHRTKQLVCKCIAEPNQRPSTTADSDSAASTAARSPIKPELTAVRLYYAVAVGDHRWTVTFLPLNVENVGDAESRAQIIDWINSVSTLIHGTLRTAVFVFALQRQSARTLANLKTKLFVRYLSAAKYNITFMQNRI